MIVIQIGGVPVGCDMLTITGLTLAVSGVVLTVGSGGTSYPIALGDRVFVTDGAGNFYVVGAFLWAHNQASQGTDGVITLDAAAGGTSTRMLSGTVFAFDAGGGATLTDQGNGSVKAAY